MMLPTPAPPRHRPLNLSYTLRIAHEESDLAVAGVTGDDASIPDLQERLEGALAQCVFCLYDVDLPWRDEHWGGEFEVRLFGRGRPEQGRAKP